MNYFDGHADTLTEIRTAGETLAKNSGDLDLDRVSAFAGSYGQVFALWKDRKQLEDTPEREFQRMYDRAAALLAGQGERICLCRKKGDLHTAFSKGKAAALLAMEDISLMGNQAEQIRQLGFTSAMLTWNYENEYGYGAACNQRGRLKEKGREMALRLLEQQIVLDISHLSDGGVEDLFAMTDRPLIASHSDVRELCDRARNLRRDQIQEIIRRGGIIGMNLYRPFLGSGPHVGLGDLFRHMEYILNLGGENALVMGTDFDGCDKLFPEGIAGAESIPAVAAAMKKSGFGGELTEKILFSNALKFWERNLPEN